MHGYKWLQIYKVSRIYLANFSQKIVSFSISRRMGGHIIIFRDGEGRCGRYCLLLEISLRATAREFESHRLRQEKHLLLAGAFSFMLKEIRTGQERSEKNSPVDCFGARVRATSGSAVGESHRLRQQKGHSYVVLFSLC